ncbi:MAG: DNA polymerase I [Dehalococcoidia bacterium]|nr:DNA polymerase I [Dehalococcoidia bacterium]
MPEARKPLLLLIDGNNLVHRAFHALPPLSVRRTGEMVNAVYGFTSMLLKVISDVKPTHCAVAFDKKGPTFRHDMSVDYKATRPPTPDDLVGQISRTRELVRDFNIPIYELDKYEADDVLGALARQASEKNIETVILTGDADAMQLVDGMVRVLYPRTMGEAVLMDATAVEEKYGVPSHLIADYKALKGDTSDNITGVKGIGEKTAVSLIRQFGGIDDIYNHLAEISSPRIQAILREGESDARRSKTLATIAVNAPVSLDLKTAEVDNFDRAKVVALFRELEFFKLIERLPGPPAKVGVQGMLFAEGATGSSRQETPKNYSVVTSAEQLIALARRLKAAGQFVFEVIVGDADPMTAQLVGLALCPAEGEAYYIPLAHVGLEAGPQLTPDEVMAALSPVFADGGIAKSAHNANFAATMLAGNGLDVSGLFYDTMIAAHLLGEQALELKSLALGHLGLDLPVLSTGHGAKQITAAMLAVREVADYACAAADAVIRLTPALTSSLEKEKLKALFHDLEMPLVPVLVRMQRAGVLLDKALLSDMSRRLGEQLTAIESEIYKIAGMKFNVNSPKQLGEVLFGKLNLPCEHKKRGTWSTEASVLESLRQGYPVAGHVLEYRQLSKLKGTYVDALPGLVNPRTGRVHTRFNQTRTATGRLSSSDPNLQNIPVRGEQGREIRRAFIASPGCVLLSCDYSQIDLRVLAHLSEDPLLMATFERDEDVHTATAAQLFGVAPSAVTSDMRRLAKVVNFGVIYGMSGYGLEQATEFSREEANKFISAYFEKYIGVRKYLDETVMQARREGYVQTLLGRRRYFPEAEINSHNRMIREAAERMAINMPVQGTSADIIKVAMLDIEKELARRSLTSRLILQVHDELIFETPEAELEIMREMAPRLMSGAVKMSVPVRVDFKMATDWGRME